MLIKIFETLSGKTCPQKPTPNPKMEIQKLENITMGLEFGKTLFPITMIQSKDIMEADKNPKLLLGLVWQMILHFQVLGEQDSSDKKSQVEKQRGAKEKLLKWCQEQTKGHNHIDISDLTVKSWGDGMGFCALVHAYNPDLLDYNSLNPANKKENLALAFSLAEKNLDIPQFLDVDDVLNPENQPDEQCFITYLSEFPLAFLHKAAKDLESGEARRKEEEARRKEEEERRKREDEERQRREEEERRKREEDERKRKEDEDRKRAEDDAKRREEEARRKEEEDARAKAEKKAKKASEAADAERRAKEDEEKRRREAETNAEEEERKRRDAEKAFEEERERMRKENEAIRNQLEAVKKKLIGKIGVTVVEARGLPKSDHMGSKSDPYCVLFLERQKEKTRTVKKTLNPKWQAEFEFYVSDANAALEVSVFDWNRIFSDELLGKVTIPVKEMKDGVTEDKWFPLTGKEGKKKDTKESAGEIRLVLNYKLER